MIHRVALVLAAALVMVMAVSGGCRSSSGVPGAAAPVFLDSLSSQSATFLPTGTEPRAAVGPDGRRWVITNNAAGAPEIFGSVDGSAWSRAGAFPQPASPSPDVDLVVTRTGRLVAVELDGAGFSAAVSYSDDGGATWQNSPGPALIDQDRPWLAVGPDDPGTGEPLVYLLYHNVVAGAAIMNVFVSTSTDGGASFGAPVPVTLPGSQAFADLQCGDSSGPSGIAVNRASGRIYVAWGTRTSALGGCGASIPPGVYQVSIESPTRVWVATSADGSPGSWTTSLAVDESSSGKIVGVLWSPIALDSAGNIYVAYPETPNPYPDYRGAAVRYRWAPADLARWSAPVTVAPADAAGHFSVHVVAGAPGKLDFAYFSGRERQGASPAWFVTVAQTLDGLSDSPHFTEIAVANFPSYTGTLTELAGACGSGPTAGIEQGTLCPRAADNFGLALDRACRYIVTWPVIENDADRSHAGTWVATQNGGPIICD